MNLEQIHIVTSITPVSVQKESVELEPLTKQHASKMDPRNKKNLP